jgi:hypothetical protein
MATPNVHSNRGLRPARLRALIAASCALSGCFSNSSNTRSDAGGFMLDTGIPEWDSGSGGDTGAPDAAGDAPGDGATACTPSGTPVMHTADITADETWASGIHVVPASLQIKGGAHLTIAPCSEVQLGPGASLTVPTTGGSLDAVGTAASPIRFVAQTAGMPWGAISVTSPATVHLAYATLAGGGTGPHDTTPLAGASLAGNSSDATRPVVLLVDHVTVSGSAGLGVFLHGARFDPASTALTITGAGWYPLYTGVASTTEIPDGTYTGNAIDQILLQTYGTAATDDMSPFVADVTMHDRGVPYRVGTGPASIVVGDGLGTSASASLTIAAGVKVLFTPQGAGSISQLMVRAKNAGAAYQAQGALVVQGTAAAPVVLDSAGTTPAAGDWQGLYFSNVIAPQTSIQYAHILHAGGPSSAVGLCPSTPAGTNNAATCAIVMMLDAPPPAAFLASSDIESAPCGVYRGWTMTDVDFTASNQFVGVPGCTQTDISQAGGACTPACPTSP